MKQFAKEIGAPDAIICDAAGKQTSGALREFCHKIGTALWVLEEGTPWAKKAELYIGILKESVSKDMKESNAPLVFWNYCVERRAIIDNLTAKTNMFQMHGSNAHTYKMGEKGDISNICQFQFYEWCYYCDSANGFPHHFLVLGRVLGPSMGIGNKMAQWILKVNGRVVSRSSACPLRTDEIYNYNEEKKRKVFDELIELCWVSSLNFPINFTKTEDQEFEE